MISQAARPRKSPMLTTSVAVVRKMLDAVAGSAPSRFSASGTAAPAMPDTAQLPAIAKNVIAASVHACEWPW